MEETEEATPDIPRVYMKVLLTRYDIGAYLHPPKFASHIDTLAQ
jgi:hypothetical protein